MDLTLAGWIGFFALSIFVCVYLVLRQVVEQRREAQEGGGAGTRYAEGLEFFETVSPFVMMLRPLARGYLSAMSTKDIAEMQKMIGAAGLKETISLEEFAGLRFLGVCFGLLMGVLFMLLGFGLHPMVLLAMMMFAMVGWIYPNNWLSSLARDRETRIFRGLSDTLDVLAVSVSAGLEMRDALERVVTIGSEPMLDHEIRRTLNEIDKGGKSIEQGFEDLRDRVAMPEMTSFVNVILMAFRLGASGMSEILIEQADAIRQERILRAERRANQMGSKILFPIALFIFPAVIVTLLGPLGLRAYMSFTS